jgi:hypothetical protein
VKETISHPVQDIFITEQSEEVMTNIRVLSPHITVAIRTMFRSYEFSTWTPHNVHNVPRSNDSIYFIRRKRDRLYKQCVARIKLD